MYKSPNIEFKIGEDIGCNWPDHLWMIGKITNVNEDSIKMIYITGTNDYFKHGEEIGWTTKLDSEAEFYTPEELKIKLL